MNPQSPRETVEGTPQYEQEENTSDLVALVPRGNHMKKLQKFSRQAARNRWRACILATVVAVLVATVTRTCLFSTRNNSSDKKSTFTSKQATPNGSNKLAPILEKEGWIGAMEQYRHELVTLAVDFSKQQQEKDESTDILMDITPLYKYLYTAINTLGFRAVSKDLFDEIEWYYPKDWYRGKQSFKRCNNHGIRCEAYDLWWLYHYVGAIAAEQLLQQGYVVLDGITQEHLTSPADVMKELFRIQKQPHTTKASFHVVHGFLWNYLATTQPTLQEYPVELALEFCGDYLQDKHVSASAHKNIRWECFHGLGHGIFMILAKRQLGIQPQYNHTSTTSTVFRPKGGFTLTNANFCQAFDICNGAPSDVNDVPIKACTSGIKHSYWLFSKELSKTQSRKKSEAFFQELQDQVC